MVSVPKWLPVTVATGGLTVPMIPTVRFPVPSMLVPKGTLGSNDVKVVGNGAQSRPSAIPNEIGIVAVPTVIVKTDGSEYVTVTGKLDSPVMSNLPPSTAAGVALAPAATDPKLRSLAFVAVRGAIPATLARTSADALAGERSSLSL